MTNIAFIGLGIMGAPMAVNLAKAGFAVTGHNRSPRYDALLEAGGSSADTVAEAVAEADVIITMVPDSPDVAAVLQGEHGVFASAQAGALIIDFSTIRPDVAQELAAVAQEKGLRLGAAPDTVLGAGIQTCRRLIDEGAIGTPIGANAWMMNHGSENWHPAPEFFYKRGGGPLLDMGPYYLTTLVTLFGPVKRVTGSSTISFPERVITSEPKRGQRVAVECPTHVNGVLEFASGAIGNVVMSFDTWATEVPWIEIYGTEGTLSVPDPNGFGGPVLVRVEGAQYALGREVAGKIMVRG